MLRLTTAVAVTLALSTFSLNTAAVPISIVQVGTFSTPPAGGNTDAGFSIGNKFVIKSTYDAAATIPVVRNIGGLDFRVIDLNAGSNSFQLMVPMEALGQVYTQTEANHLPFFTPNPQIIFTETNGGTHNLPPVTDPMLSLPGAPDFIGYEFEGDFTGSNPAGPTTGNFAELSVGVGNVSGTQTATFVTDMARCSDATCADYAIAIRSLDQPAVPNVVLASNVVAEAGPDIVYSVAAQSQTTDAGSANNNLGNARTDKEDFVTYDWSVVGGGALVGGDVDGSETNTPPAATLVSRPVENVNKTVALQDSGLTTTIDTRQWQVNVTEDLTGLSGSDTLNVGYQNVLPTIGTASATPQGDDLLFALAFGDLDLDVNALIANFEQLSVQIMVDMMDFSSLFADLINTGSQLLDHATLLTQFGAGPHQFEARVSDRAILASGGSIGPVTAGFEFNVAPGAPVPVPTSAALFALATLGLAGFSRRRRVESRDFSRPAASDG